MHDASSAPSSGSVFLARTSAAIVIGLGTYAVFCLVLGLRHAGPKSADLLVFLAALSALVATGRFRRSFQDQEEARVQLHLTALGMAMVANVPRGFAAAEQGILWAAFAFLLGSGQLYALRRSPGAPFVMGLRGLLGVASTFLHLALFLGAGIAALFHDLPELAAGPLRVGALLAILIGFVDLLLALGADPRSLPRLDHHSA